MAETNSPRRPAPQTQPVFIWPTPEEQDRVFYVEKDSRLPKNAPDKVTFEYGDPYHENTVRFPNHKLIYVMPETDERWSRWYYASDRINQDEYNWEHAQADIGGQRFNIVRRTYLNPRATYDPLTPAQGAAMPNVPVGKFPAGYVMAEREQRRTGDKEFDSLYVIETRSYVQKVSIISNEFDELTGGNLPITLTWYYATEEVPGTGLTAAELFADSDNSYWALQDDANLRIGKQLTAAWYLITESKMVAGTPVGGVITIGSYDTTENYYWPAVLDDVEFMDWERRNGGTDIFPRIVMLREAFKGPCKATVTRSWSKDPQSVTVPDQMLPVGIDYASPFFRLNIPDCLHGSFNAVCDIGTADPDYKQNVGSTRNFPATNYTDWPATIFASDEQAPYKGGYLRTSVTITRPA